MFMYHEYFVADLCSKMIFCLILSLVTWPALAEISEIRNTNEQNSGDVVAKKITFDQTKPSDDFLDAVVGIDEIQQSERDVDSKHASKNNAVKDNKKNNEKLEDIEDVDEDYLIHADSDDEEDDIDDFLEDEDDDDDEGEAVQAHEKYQLAIDEFQSIDFNKDSVLDFEEFLAHEAAVNLFA